MLLSIPIAAAEPAPAAPRVKLGGTLFEDANGDGLQQATEPDGLRGDAS